MNALNGQDIWRCKHIQSALELESELEFLLQQGMKWNTDLKSYNQLKPMGIIKM